MYNVDCAVVQTCHSHVPLGLDDGVDILRVYHTEHSVTEHSRGCGFHGAGDAGKQLENKCYTIKCYYMNVKQLG